jgi:glycerol-3-phosphate dehydrogenase (NAD(P)+)
MRASVIGGGSWGSAMALHLGGLDINTKLWIREKDVYENTLRYRQNKTFLPGYVFPASVSFYNNIKETIVDTDFLFIAIPSKYCLSIYKVLAPLLSPRQIIISLTKGIEKNSLKRMSELMEDIFSSDFIPKSATLSGPSFAREVAESHPTAVVIASKDLKTAKLIQQNISNEYFRAYTTDDVTGVELAGALKNIIAISAGICAGLEFGSNSIAALITRGIAEISRLGVKLGARQETFSGLAGIGDLVLTCTGKLSRNRYVGFELGKGKSLDQIVSKMNMVAEGITTTFSIHYLSKRENIEMPICEQVYQILYKNKDPRTALQDLMTRKLKHENIS